MSITFNALFPLFVVVMPQELCPPALPVSLWVRRLTVSAESNTTGERKSFLAVKETA